MLGTNPHAGSRTTRLGVTILPLRLTFVDGGLTLDGHDALHDVVRSPIFRRADFRSGRSQYADAMQRAEFWNDVKTRSPAYHVLLNPPIVLPALSLTVPRGSGFAFRTGVGAGGVLSSHFVLTVLASRIEHYYQPQSGLLVLLNNVQGDQFLGFHYAYTPTGQSAPMTVMWGPYLTPNVLTDPSMSDVWALSHEVAEWINDPYTTNAVPAWKAPGTLDCYDDTLEVADPLEFVSRPSFAITSRNRVWHLSDVAGLSWFAHEVPSRGIGGRYSYNGGLTAPAVAC